MLQPRHSHAQLHRFFAESEVPNYLHVTRQIVFISWMNHHHETLIRFGRGKGLLDPVFVEVVESSTNRFFNSLCVSDAAEIIFQKQREFSLFLDAGTAQHAPPSQ